MAAELYDFVLKKHFKVLLISVFKNSSLIF